VDGHDGFMLQSAFASIPERGVAPPGGRAHLRSGGTDPGLLAQLPDRSRLVGLAGFEPTPGQLPPLALLGIRRVTGVKQQHMAGGIEHDEANDRPLHERQVVGSRPALRIHHNTHHS
jgi:hypothetical protein